jgi:2-dehydropantoate 2-reductase
MRYLIIGAGALGSVFGGLLQRSGQSVTFIGRGRHFEQARAQGLTIDGIWGEFPVGPLTATADEPAASPPYEVILLCVKSYHTEEVCRLARGRLAPGGLIVSVQNGLGNLEIIAQEFGVPRTTGARVIFGAQVSRPGLVTVTVYAAPVLLGPLVPGPPPEPLPRLAAELNRAAIPTEVVDQIMPHLWDKVLYNCALNPLGAILGAPYGSLGDHPETRELMRRLIAEIYQVARARGLALQYPEAAGYFRHFSENLVPPTAAHWPSMWQDLQAGRRTEIEALNGAICRYGREAGVPTPYNETLSRLIRFLEERSIQATSPLEGPETKKS